MRCYKPLEYFFSQYFIYKFTFLVATANTQGHMCMHGGEVATKVTALGSNLLKCSSRSRWAPKLRVIDDVTRNWYWESFVRSMTMACRVSASRLYQLSYPKRPRCRARPRTRPGEAEGGRRLAAFYYISTPYPPLPRRTVSSSSSRPWSLRGSSSPDHSPSDPVSDPSLSLSPHG